MWDFGSGTNFQGTADQWQAGNFHSAASQVKLTATNSATWYVTGVQLEVGSTATEFEHRSYGEELALCQRYFCLPGRSGSFNFSAHAANCYVDLAISFSETMRTAPTLVADTSGWTFGSCTYHSAASATEQGFRLLVKSSAAATNATVAGMSIGDITADAEL